MSSGVLPAVYPATTVSRVTRVPVIRRTPCESASKGIHSAAAAWLMASVYPKKEDGVGRSLRNARLPSRPGPRDPGGPPIMTTRPLRPPRRRRSAVSLLAAALLLPGALHTQGAAQGPDAGDELAAFLRVVAVAGREEPARDFVRQRLAGLPVQPDAVGDLVLTGGSGPPRRL